MSLEEHGLPSPIRVNSFVVGDKSNMPDIHITNRTLIFRNGEFQTPQVHYYTVPGKAIFNKGVIFRDDLITVVTLP